MDEELNLKLQPLREQIDALDAKLLALLNERAAVVLEVGEVKKHLAAPVFRPERELQVIARLQALGAAGPLRPEHVESIWREIMSASRSLERELTIAFLGPVGTYSELAMQTYFGQSVKGLPCASIDEVFRAVEAGSADYGVVPVENSTEGAVSRTLDLMLDTTLAISGEIAVPIHHNLLTRTGTLDGVTRVCAHAQAIAQCQEWLSKHAPQLNRQAVSSNAEAARLAADDPTMAAIAGDRAAAHYGLQPVASLIQDDPHNRTRFVVVGGESPAATGRDQTSMILSVKNEPGAVFRMLEPFARHGVSMTRFESRPARRGAWEYWFYVDIDGHSADENVATALDELDHSAAFVKILGSYPRSN
ncbi:prephenate dehydratase [Pararobbsia silviterrae]|uniref:Bifunctional chorismate mutase/prephenate dehydratase n=1 Tax=Pararobbsia silviterrae TaxID=1792498 RepID=A0A494YAP9_9BURK|nr:prephenate dehydratase [Pararobbsia silviterrae]RKP59245.1 prephenate dehydratase [Pararobbsia silviterrae]